MHQPSILLMETLFRASIEQIRLFNALIGHGISGAKNSSTIHDLGSPELQVT
jgi:hypothetical protein